MTLAPPAPVTGRESPLGVRQGVHQRRNPVLPLDLGWIQQVQVDGSAAGCRAGTLAARRTVKKQWQAAWLLKAIACMDLATLAGDDTPGKIHRLCAREACGAVHLKVILATRSPNRKRYAHS